MKKFSEMQYVRPDADAVQASLQAYIEKLRTAASYEEMRDLFLAEKEQENEWGTMANIAHVRNTIDTNDVFYEEEMKFWNTAMPEWELLTQQSETVILSSPWRSQWEEEFGSFFLKDMEVRQKLTDPAIVPDLIQESDLTQQYSKASATASTEFRGERCNFYGLLKHMQSTDREERRDAMLAWGDLYASISEQLDSIYDQLVAVRCQIAKKLGFDSYIDFIYLQRGRYDYKPEDIASFRRQVKEVIVPICAKLRKEQEKRLGISHLHYYDEGLMYPDGNAIPEGTKDELVAKAQQMYRSLSPETGAFFDSMVEQELFDLETRPGKRPGGYCTFFRSIRMPFIFSNFNGTSADVDVLTHEAGHAFEAYTAARNIRLLDMVFPTSEVAEIHSMSMEFFTHPYMELFFSENSDKYRYSHLVDSLQTIPYMVCVDEFQHRVFEQPSMTAGERRAVWKQLEETYLPWRDYDGHPFLSEGGFWMQKQHIFLFPFYYIDYALAQMGAFEFYGRMKQEPKTAWEDYYRLCQAGGSKGYFDLLKIGKLQNPFADGTLARIMDSLKEDLEQDNS